MSDEEATRETPVEPEAGDAWSDVVAEVDALGEALGRWLKAAASDAENKRRLEELSDRLEGLVSDIGESAKGAVDSEVGQSFKEAADKTGDAFKLAGEKLTGEVGPRLADVFKAVGDKLRDAADKIEERQEPSAAEPAAEPGTPPETPQD